MLVAHTESGLCGLSPAILPSRYQSIQNRGQQLNVRAITPYDQALLTDWINKDEDHRDRVTPDFFYKNTTAVFEDSKGPVFFIRTTLLPDAVVQLDIQFDAATPLRTAKMLTKGFPPYAQMFRNNGIQQLRFESTSKPLIEFCKSRLGFLDDPQPNWYVRNLN